MSDAIAEPRFLIPVGSPIEIRRVDGDREWQTHFTKIELQLSETDGCDGQLFLFKHAGFQLKVREKLIRRIGVREAI